MRLFVLLLCVLFFNNLLSQSIGLNTNTPDPSAALDVVATDKGLLVPRMDSNQRNNIASPANGLLVFDTDTESFWYCHSTIWYELGNGAFENDNGVVRNKGDHTMDDFVFGSESLPPSTSIDDSLMFYDKSKAAFRVGAVDGNEWSPSKIGDYSFVAGKDGEASGTSSTSLGFSNTADGDNSVAIGSNNDSNANNSAAIGSSNDANGSYSMALGRSNDSGGRSSIALGESNTAMGDYSFAGGRSNNTQGGTSSALGYLNTLLGDYSFAAGRENDANGIYSIGLGFKNNALGENSLSGGSYSEANGTHGFAYGLRAKALKDYGIAIGEDAKANENFGVSIGYETVAEGFSETVLGRYDTDYIPSSTTDIQPTDRLFVIGNGNPFTFTRSNALTILNNGNVGIGNSATNPTTLLHLKNTGSFNPLRVENMTTDNNLTDLVVVDNLGVYKKRSVSTLSGLWEDPGSGNIQRLTGNVLIGTSTDTGFKLSIEGTNNAVKLGNTANESTVIIDKSSQQGDVLELNQNSGYGLSDQAALSTTYTNRLTTKLSYNNKITNTGYHGIYAYTDDPASNTHLGYFNVNKPSISGGSIWGVTSNINYGNSSDPSYAFSASVDGNFMGDKYGYYTVIPSTAGGTHYGLYSDVLSNSGFAAYLNGRVSIGNMTSNHYILPETRGSVDQVMKTDGSGNVSWVDPETLPNIDNQNLTGATLSGTNLQIDIENGSSASVDLSGIDTDTDDQTLMLSGTQLNIEDGNSVNLGSLSNQPGFDDQTLSFGGNTLSISNGNVVNLSSLKDNLGNHQASQPLFMNGNQVSGLPDPTSFNDAARKHYVDVQIGFVESDLMDLDDDHDFTRDLILDHITNDNDLSFTNEIQTLSKSGSTITLSGGGSVTDTDTDDQTLTLTGSVLGIVDGNSIDLSPIINDNQNLTLTGTNLSIEDGNTVDLSPIQDGTGTDDQTLTFTGTNLSIEDGNSVDLSALQDGTGTDDQDLTFDSGTLTLSIEDGNSVVIDDLDWQKSGSNVYKATGKVALGSSTLPVNHQMSIDGTGNQIRLGSNLYGEVVSVDKNYDGGIGLEVNQNSVNTTIEQAAIIANSPVYNTKIGYTYGGGSSYYGIHTMSNNAFSNGELAHFELIDPATTTNSSPVGVFSILNHNNTGGNNFAFKAELDGTGSSNKYGYHVTIPISVGGIHYGIYSDVKNTNGYAAYLEGKVSIGSGPLDRYNFPTSKGNNGQILLINSLGDLNWINTSAIDDQTLSLAGTNLTIADGNTIDLASIQDGTGTDDQNLTGATLTGTNLQIDIENGSSALVDLASLDTDTDDQTLSLSGTDLSITDGNTIDISSIQAFENTGTLVRNTGNTDDNFVFGHTELPPAGDLTEKLFFYESASGAFRTGELFKSDAFASTNLGAASFASGYNTIASGSYSFASGYNTEADGHSSTAIGYQTAANGARSFAAGRNTTADAYASVVIGRYNIGGGTINSWVDNEPLFEVGNGTLSVPSNALTVLKNGKTGIGTSTPDTSFTVVGVSRASLDDTEVDYIEMGHGGNNAFINAEGTGNLDIRHGDGNIMTLTPGKFVGIKTNNPSSDLHIIHTNNKSSGGLRLENTSNSDFGRLYVASSDGHLRLYSDDQAGAIGNFNDMTGAYSATSDRRLKEEFEELRFDWDSFMQLQALMYEYKSDKDDEKYIGMIAQDVQKIYPEMISYNEDEDIYHMNYDALGVIAIKAVQELKNQNEVLKASIKKKDDKTAKLEARLNKIEAFLAQSGNVNHSMDE